MLSRFARLLFMAIGLLAGLPASVEAWKIHPCVDVQTKLFLKDQQRVTVTHAVWDTTCKGLKLQVIGAKAGLGKQEDPKSIAARTKAVLLINGGYFDLPAMPIGAFRIDKKDLGAGWLGRTALWTDGKRVQFGAVKTSLTLYITCQASGENLVFTNGRFNLKPAPDGWSWVNTVSEGLWNWSGLGYALTQARACHAETCFPPFVAFGKNGGPPLACVQKSASQSEAVLQNVRVEVHQEPKEAGNWPTILEAGPRLVMAGKTLDRAAAENFKTDGLFGPYPAARTVMGTSKNGRFVHFLSIPGRSLAGEGLTLKQAAEVAVDLGMEEAMNLDGGPSTVMILQGKLMGKAKNDTLTAPIANSIVLVSKP